MGCVIPFFFFFILALWLISHKKTNNLLAKEHSEYNCMDF